MTTVNSIISGLSQGAYVEKKTNLYVKISLMENDRVFSSKKVKCSNNKTIIDFSKEVFFNLQEKEAQKCSILLELKKDLGVGNRSKYFSFGFLRILFIILSSDEKISQLILKTHGGSNEECHYSMILMKPYDRIYLWHNAECF